MSKPPPRPHPLTRSAFATKANRLLETVWARGIDKRPLLEPDYIWKHGTKGFTREDEVSIRSEAEVADFRERLDRLCRSLREEADLNALGHAMAYGQLRKAVRERHRLGRLWRERPELAGTPLAPPIAVVGLMRSGTTRVQRLLAADPRHSGTRVCDSYDPVPSRPDMRPVKTRLGLALLRRLDPWLNVLHPVTATGVDEEIGWLAAALSPPAFEAQWRIPSFVRWSEARDSAPVYAEFARILRTDAAHHGNAAKPRILKCPQFTEDLPELLGEMPETRIVATYRTNDDVWQSAVSMVACQSGYQTASPDLTQIEEECERKLRYRSARMAGGLDATDARIARVTFDELNSDWRGAMRGIYETFAIPFDDRAVQAMEREVARARKQSHGEHGRQLAKFDLTRPSRISTALRATG